jgi:hypothetical protein
VRGERQPREARPALRVEGEITEVVPVEVTVRHRHRLTPVRTHREQRSRMVLRVQQADLSPDELRVRSGTASLLEQPHLRLDLTQGVNAVDAHLVGILGVVARRAGQVAPREDPVGAFAADRVAAKRLRVRPRGYRQSGPPLVEGTTGLGVDGASSFLEAT